MQSVKLKTQGRRAKTDGLLSMGGFTLIELLVSVSIFSIVIIIAVGALLNLARAADHSHAILTAINNLDFAMEQMGRTIRVGGNYYCSDTTSSLSSDTQDCLWTAGKSGLVITDKDNRRIAYRLNHANGSLERENLSFTPSRIFSITSPEVVIENLTFNVFGSHPTDNLQPRVMIRIKGKTAVSGLKPYEQVSFDLQTMVSQRDPDL